MTVSPFGSPLQAPGGLVALVEPVAPAPGATVQWRCRILDANGGLVACTSVTVYPAAAYVQEATATGAPASILHYSGAQKHPAGDQAALSWVNDQSLGLLRATCYAPLPIGCEALRRQHATALRDVARKGSGPAEAPTVMIELMPYEKDLMRTHALHLHPQVDRQLRDGRYRWIECTRTDLDDIIGSLSYVCNRTRSRELAEALDEVCSILERHLRAIGRP